MAGVARARRTMAGWAAEQFGDAVDGEIAPLADIDCATIGPRAIHRQQVGAHHVPHMGKVSALLTVAVDWQRLSLSPGAQENAHNRDVGTLARHPRTKHVEITQGQSLKAVELMEQAG